MNCLWDDLIDGVNGTGESSLLAASVVAKSTVARQRYSFCRDGVELTITIRERETLKLIAEGLTVPEAARKMQLSPRTVEFYVKTLRYKFKAPSKLQLVKHVIENDILSKLTVSFY
jgi:DNA-binding CsgD family transcriptional regulator